MKALCSAQLSWVLPQPLAGDAAEHRSHFILPTPAFVSLGLSSALQHRAKSRLIASHVRSTPLTHRGWSGWFLSTAILHPLSSITSAGRTKSGICWWLATHLPSAQTRDPIRHTAVTHAVSLQTRHGAGWDMESAPNERLRHYAALPGFNLPSCSQGGSSQ